MKTVWLHNFSIRETALPRVRALKQMIGAEIDSENRHSATLRPWESSPVILGFKKLNHRWRGWTQMQRIKTGQNHPECGQTNPGCAQTSPGCAQTNPGCEQTHPRCEQTHPRCERTNPGCAQTSPGCAQTSPGCDQTDPGCGQTNPGCRRTNPYFKNLMPSFALQGRASPLDSRFIDMRRVSAAQKTTRFHP